MVRPATISEIPLTNYVERPLNPELYALLKDRLDPNLQIANAGQSMVASRFQDSSRPGGYFLSIVASGEYYKVNCFAGETLVATPAGDKQISSLVGRTKLLVPNKKGLASWKEVEVRSFGRQALCTLTLRRRRTVKTIRVTPDHRWIVSGRLGLYREVLTRDLKPGDRLASSFTRTIESYGLRQPHVSVVGVMSGFSFGDGSHANAPKARTTTRLMAKKDIALLPYFKTCRLTRQLSGGRYVWQVEDLPRSWKQLPASDESLSFLLGWLAGYFAADGTVSKSGQATLYSANKGNLEFAKGICYQLGVRVGPILTKRRKAEGCVPGSSKKLMYALTFSTRQLPADFWVQRHHRRRVSKALRSPAQKSNWQVVSISSSNSVEEVFCAVVPGVEKFVLADNLLTMNCPFCNDTRQRLWVNHMFGQPNTHGFNELWPAICYNENCLHSSERRRELYTKIFGIRNKSDRLRPMQILQGEVSVDPHEVRTPGELVRLDRLDMYHPACQYVIQRNFDPVYLGQRYGIAWCREAREEYRMAGNRLIIPIEQGGQLLGWQARHIGEANWKGVPKYYGCPGMAKRALLYAYEHARQWPFVIVFEGVTSVWRHGGPSVAIFGKTLSQQQQMMIQATWPGKPVLLALDPDARDSEEEALQELRRVGVTQPVSVKWPEGSDPAEMSKEFGVNFIRSAAFYAGLNIPEW